MTGSILLLGGSDLRPSDWAHCITELEKQGHQARALDWAGLPWQEGVEAVIADLVSHLSPLENPIFLGHSAAGLLLPRCRKIVPVFGEIYLAALIPQPGASFFEQMFDCPVDVFHPEWIERENARTGEQVRVHEMLYGQPFADEKLEPGPRAYLKCTADAVIRPEWQDWTARTLLQVEPFSLNSGHLAPVEDPRGLSAQIGEILARWETET